MDPSEHGTHYDVLGVSPDASAEAISDQYRALAKVLHPDAGGDRVAFEVLQDSFHEISDPGRRAVYDAALAARAGTSPETKPTRRVADAPRESSLSPNAQAFSDGCADEFMLYATMAPAALVAAIIVTATSFTWPEAFAATGLAWMLLLELYRMWRRRR